MHHSIKLNKTPTWCKKIQILLLQTFSTCFGRQAPIIRDETVSFVPNMTEWRSTCNHNYLYRWLPCQYFVLLMMGAWRPKHVEKVCSNKICILLHHVGVLFNSIWCFVLDKNGLLAASYKGPSLSKTNITVWTNQPTHILCSCLLLEKYFTNKNQSHIENDGDEAARSLW